MDGWLHGISLILIFVLWLDRSRCLDYCSRLDKRLEAAEKTLYGPLKVHIDHRGGDIQSRVHRLEQHLDLAEEQI